MNRLTLLALPLLAGCFRLGPDDLKSAQDADGDGEPARAYGGLDCDDSDASINPSAVEMCDGIDNDCDGNTDESDAADASVFYADVDGDGFGDFEAETVACTVPAGHVEDDTDCDDADAAVNPGADEVCNGIDDDCDDLVDPEDAAPGTWYADEDGDGFGDPETSWESCEPEETWVANNEDCNDDEPAINPSATEECDGQDNDCDDEVDEAGSVGESLWFPDLDEDGYGDRDADEVEACDPPEDHVADSSDCDDTNAEMNPGEVEICDQIDNDCDGDIDYALNVGSGGAAGYTSIQDAIDASSFSDGERICVHAGTYIENLVIDRDVWLEGEEKDTTIIDGNLAGRVLSITGTSRSALMKGFTLQRGNSNEGAAVHAQNAGITLEDLIIRDNVAVTDWQCSGAAIRMSGGTSPEWNNIRVEDNTAECGESWGMIYNRDNTTTVMNNLSVRGNSIRSGGYAKGGLVGYYGNWEITNAVFAGNEIEYVASPNYGYSDIRGGVFSLVLGSISMENVTIHGEQCSNPAGHIEACIGFGDQDTVMSFKNVSVTGVNASYSTLNASVIEGVAAYSYSNFGSYPSPGFSDASPSSALGNISTSPGFEDTTNPDPTTWNLRLASGSSLIDAGDPTVLDDDGTTSDIGAYGGPGGDSW